MVENHHFTNYVPNQFFVYCSACSRNYKNSSRYYQTYSPGGMPTKFQAYTIIDVRCKAPEKKHSAAQVKTKAREFAQ